MKVGEDTDHEWGSRLVGTVAGKEPTLGRSVVGEDADLAKRHA